MFHTLVSALAMCTAVCETQLVPKGEEKPLCCAAAKAGQVFCPAHKATPFPAGRQSSARLSGQGRWREMRANNKHCFAEVECSNCSLLDGCPSSPQLMTLYFPPNRADFHKVKLQLYIAMHKNWLWGSFWARCAYKNTSSRFLCSS